MGYIYYNANPLGRQTDDCVKRALSKALDYSWDRVHVELAVMALAKAGIETENDIWGEYLERKGFDRYPIPDTCPFCYTIKDFCNDNPNGTFIIGTGSHVVCVIDGDYYDTWDSGDKIPLYCFMRKEG